MQILSGHDRGKRRFLLHHLGPALLAAGVLLALETTRMDTAVSSWFFHSVTGVFPLHYDAGFEIVMHHRAKLLVVLIASAVIAALLLSFVIPEMKHRRRLLMFLGLALTLAPAAVTLLKAVSPRHCPYDLAEYGGDAVRLSLFEPALPDQAPGRCFPGGHASAGFCLLAFYFVGLELGNRGVARTGLWGGLTAGMLFGMARVAQGAHFLSHNLWAALVCWLVILALYVNMIGPRAPR